MRYLSSISLALTAALILGMFSVACKDGGRFVAEAREHYYKGNDLLDDGLVEEAIEEYSEAIRKKPDFLEAYFSRGISFRILGEYRPVIDDMDEVIDINPEFVRAYVERGLSYKFLAHQVTDIEEYEDFIAKGNADLIKACELDKLACVPPQK